MSDAALLVASDRISRMLRLLPLPLLQRMRRCSASVDIIGQRQQVSDLPEYRHLKGERGHYAGDAERADRGQRAATRITLVGLVANLGLAGAKGFAGVVGNSAAMVADAAHSLLGLR